MPNRVIKESFKTDERISALSDFQFRVWVSLIVSVDGNGTIKDDPFLLKEILFPTRKRVTVQSVQDAVSYLASIGCIVRYIDLEGQSMLCFPKWASHQRVRTCVNTCQHVSAQRKEKESNKEIEIETDIKENNSLTRVKESPRFSKPTVEEIAEYCNMRGNSIDAQTFYDFYESKGWVVGRSPMKDWRAAVRLWEQRDKERPISKPKSDAKPGFDLDEFFELATGGSR